MLFDIIKQLQFEQQYPLDNIKLKILTGYPNEINFAKNI